VPVGVQIELPTFSTSGWPPAMTRVEPVSHCPVTHGPLPLGGGGIAQPAIAYGLVIVATG
jgi:hypothetical protein